MYHLDTCEDQLKDFQRVVTGAMNRCLPIRLVKRHFTDKPWITSEIKDAIKKRQRTWAKGNNHFYKMHRNRVIKLSKSGRRRFCNDKVSHMRDTNPKKWWDNNKLSSGLSKPATLTNITVNGTILRDTDLANAINESFCNVASDITPLEFTAIPVTQIPGKYSISPDEVERSLSTIQERQPIGPDDIPNWLLKNVAPIVCRPVCSIFNSSIRQGEVPQLWKSADVLPVRKIPHPKSVDSGDLMPISLTPVPSKVLEGFVFKWLAPIVLPKIDSNKFGGVKNSSATTALIHLIHQWLSATEIPQPLVRSCLIDFSKAFDRINHNILLCKLQTLGVPPILLNWCASFLRILSSE